MRAVTQTDCDIVKWQSRPVIISTHSHLCSKRFWSVKSDQDHPVATFAFFIKIRAKNITSHVLKWLFLSYLVSEHWTFPSYVVTRHSCLAQDEREGTMADGFQLASSQWDARKPGNTRGPLLVLPRHINRPQSVNSKGFYPPHHIS